MTVKLPKIDPRTPDEIAAATKVLLDRYAGTLPQESQQLSEGLIQAFAHFAGLVIERINRMPEKAYIAFLELIGAELRPPQPARALLTFEPAAAATGAPIVVPRGTPVAAAPPAGEDTPVVFETEKELVLTGARLDAAWRVVPKTMGGHPVLWYDDQTRIATGQSEGHFLPFGVDQSFVSPSMEEIDRHRYLDLYVGDRLFGLDATQKMVELKIHTSGGGELDWSEGLKWQFWQGQAWEDIVPGGRDTPRDEPVNDVEQNASAENRVGTVKLSFVASPKHTLDGMESHWLRARLPRAASEDDQLQLNHLILAAIEARIESASGTGAPEYVFVDTLAIPDASVPFLPFGPQPLVGSSLYVGSDALFSRSGARVTVELEVVDPGNPTTDVGLFWEYWDANASAWNELPGADHHLDTIAFECPDIGNRVVNGQASRWIRLRIVKGGYGEQPRLVPDPDDPAKFNFKPESEEEWLKLPLIRIVRLEVDGFSTELAPVELVFGRHDLIRESKQLAEKEGRNLRPFWTDTTPTLYLGLRNPVATSTFDRGSVSLFFSVSEDVPQSFSAPLGEPAFTLDWEYWNGDDWHTLDVRDETKGLRRRGLVTFVVPADMAPTNRIWPLDAASWIRIKCRIGTSAANLLRALLESPTLASEPSGPEPMDSATNDQGDHDANRAGSNPQRIQLEGWRSRLGRIRTNTTWAIQSQTVQNEILGSGAGVPHQRFQLHKSPVLGSVHIEVREPTLAAQRPLQNVNENKALRPGPFAPGEAWETWKQVPDFIESESDSRHFRLDSMTGEIEFGDGRRGRLPPVGTNNIRARSYRTGGGARGNLPAGAITQLMTTIPYVQSVANPEPSTSGVDAESIESLTERGPRLLRHRGRAVAGTDFEDLALEVPGVARARSMGSSLQTEIGVVQLYLLPMTGIGVRALDVDLTHRIEHHLTARMPASVKLKLSPPTWLWTLICAKIVGESDEGFHELEVQIQERLRVFLHPLSGGTLGRGWDFGQRPKRSQLVAVIENVAGVREVAWIEEKYSRNREEGYTPRPPDDPSSIVVSAERHVIEPAPSTGIVKT